MSIKLIRQLASSVATPAATHMQFFVDENGLPQLKDDTGSIIPATQAGQVTLVETTTPISEANKAKIYAKDMGGITETFILDDQGNDIQVTSNGSLAGGGGGSPSGPAGGDLSGTYPNPTVSSVNGVFVSNSPVATQILTATSSFAASWQTLSVAVGNITGLGSGVATFLATPTSANLAAAVTNETGTGALVFANSPTLVTPALGTPSTLVLTNATGRASSSQTADRIATSGTPVALSATAPTAAQVLTATSATTAAWQNPTGGPASSLATTGSPVVVSGAAPPSTGQVLTATSATAANWQTPSGGGGLTFDPIGKLADFNAISGFSYGTYAGAPIIANLPASPADGDVLEISSLAAAAPVIINRQSITPYFLGQSGLLNPGTEPIVLVGGSLKLQYVAALDVGVTVPAWLAIESDGVNTHYQGSPAGLVSSTADGASTTTQLVDATAPFSPLTPSVVYVLAFATGPNAGVMRILSDANYVDSSTLAISPALASAPGAGDGYSLYQIDLPANTVIASGSSGFPQLLPIATDSVLGRSGSGDITSIPISSLASGLPYFPTVQNSSFTAASNTGYVLLANTGTLTVTLPVSPADGDKVELYSIAYGPSNFIQVDTGGATIVLPVGNIGGADPIVFEGTGLELGLVWDAGSTRWRTYHESLPVHFAGSNGATTPFINSVLMTGVNGRINPRPYNDDSFLAQTIESGQSVDPHPLSEVDGLLIRDESVHTADFDALTNHRYYISSYNDVVVTLPTDFADTDRIEIYGAGDGPNLVTIDSQGVYIAYGAFGTSDPTQFSAHGFHLGLRFNADDGSWESSSDEVVTRFGSGVGVLPDRVIKTDNAGTVVTTRMNLVAVSTVTSGTYNAVAWDLVPVDSSGGTIDINLPASATLQNGDTITVKLTMSGNPCNINPDGADTIDGVASPLVISTPSEWATLIYTFGGAWLQIS